MQKIIKITYTTIINNPIILLNNSRFLQNLIFTYVGESRFWSHVLINANFSCYYKLKGILGIRIRENSREWNSCVVLRISRNRGFACDERNVNKVDGNWPKDFFYFLDPRFLKKTHVLLHLSFRVSKFFVQKILCSP